MRRSQAVTIIVAIAASLIMSGEAPAKQRKKEKKDSCWPGTLKTHLECRPNDPDFKDDEWMFSSGIPKSMKKIDPDEKDILGSTGMGIDKVWTYTTGRDDVVIAVLDSGIRWNDEDIINKIYLNPKELLLPIRKERVSKTYDSDGNGVFNVRDYDDDPRVRDANNNKILDPGDLIAAFSDGIDQDKNGYVDDIAGWDFFVGDNDPNDDIDFGHGTSQARSAAAETNNGIGDAGVCPKCRVLPVRVGDSFVVDANRFARGVMFAVRSNVSVIQEALGSLNNTIATRRAIDRAYEAGIPIIASAADEYSYHHNFPGVHNHTAYVNSVRFDRGNNPRRATTAVGMNSCTNFGARVHVSVPSKGCSSEATSKLSGGVGLLQSIARDFGLGQLHAEEIYQLLRYTADDFELPFKEGRFPAKKGFDELTGYGRVDLLKAVQAIRHTRIPAMIDIEKPRWFEIVPPLRNGATIAVEGTLTFPRNGAPLNVQVDYAIGNEPAEAEFRRVRADTFHRIGLESFWKGTFGSVHLAEIQSALARNGNDGPVRNRNSVTLRVRAQYDRDGVAVTSESRRSIFVYHDEAWLPGFPIRMNSSNAAFPVVTDLDGDKKNEIILTTAPGGVEIFQVADKGQLHNRISARFDIVDYLDPQRPESAIPESPMRAAAVGDLFGTGEKQIVAASREGSVYVFRPDGTRVEPFPVTLEPLLPGESNPKQRLERGILSMPVVADIDGIPGDEIIVSGMDGKLYVWNHEGRLIWGKGIDLESPGEKGSRSKSVSTPAVGDIDGDGKPEIVVGSNQYRKGHSGLFAVRSDSSFVAHWDPLVVPAPFASLLPTVGTGHAADVKLVQADGDSAYEVVIMPVTGAVTLADQPVDRDGRLLRPRLREFRIEAGAFSDLADDDFVIEMSSSHVTDIERDGRFEFFAPLISLAMINLKSMPGVPWDVPVALGGWDVASGEPLPTYPRRMEDIMIYAPPTSADVDCDGVEEILQGSGGYLLHAFKKEGGEAEGFPKFTGGWIFSSPVVADIDNDGFLDLGALTREGYAFAWKLGIPASRCLATPNSL